MANEEPAFLTAGIEVSAKYRGAFCEAKIKKVDKNVKCKVTLKDDGKILIVQDEDIKGTLRVGSTVEVRRPDSGVYVEGVVNRVNDLSIYTVVFDDGDENTLRRTKLCLKGDRHFMKSETLDDLPLTHPEHFGTPVVRKAQKSKAALTANCSDSESEIESSDEDSESGKRTYSIHSQQNLVGRVLCVDLEERNRRTSMIPVLVVLPSADDVQLPTRHHVLVKSFKDGKFITTTISDTKEFTPEVVAKNKDKSLKNAFDKAQSYKDRKDLPQNWSKRELLGYSSSESGESSDDEPDEKKDRFVAELFKFMDDRGTPINKAPNLAGIDLNLFKLFRIVQMMGGYNRITNQMKWHVVHSKLNLPSSAVIVSTNIKQAYKKFLHAFEDFNRKLGCTMVMSSHSRMSSRSLVSFRERERDQTPKLNRTRRVGSTKDEETDQLPLKKDVVPEKMEKMSAGSPANKPATEDAVSSVAAFVKSKLQKKSGGKKDSGDSDSVSSDTPIAPAKVVSQLLSASSPSVKPSAENSRPSVVLQKVAKESEKLATPSTSKTTREEATRVTRGDMMKAKDSVAKEERTEKIGRKGDGKDNGKTKGEAEKSVDKTDGEKDEKLRGSRRTLRRATNIPNADEEGEDEAKSINSEPSETNDSITNEASPKADDETPRMISGRRHTNSDDLYAVGTRLQVKYGKGKGQKIYEAKVLETATQSGVAKYFVHYNGWNSRYDEWIHKDVIVSVLEEPSLEMPKLRNNAAMAAKSISSSARKKTSMTLLSSSKEDVRAVKSKTSVGLGPETASSAGRRTRTTSVDQVRTTPGRTRVANLKAAETSSSNSNSACASMSSSSSSSSSCVDAEEKETRIERATKEPKQEQNEDEDLSNSCQSSSLLEPPELPDMCMSEEDDCGRCDAPKIDDQTVPPGDEDDANSELPEIEREVPLEKPNIPTDRRTLPEEEHVIQHKTESPSEPAELNLKCEEKISHLEETKVNLTSPVKPANEICIKQLKQNDIDAEFERNEINKDSAIAASDTTSSKPEVESIAVSCDDASQRDVKDKDFGGMMDSSSPPSLVESCVAATKTRKKRRQLDPPSENHEECAKHDLQPDAPAEESKCERSMPDLSAERDRRIQHRKRKLSTCLESSDTFESDRPLESEISEETVEATCAGAAAAVNVSGESGDSKLGGFKPSPKTGGCKEKHMKQPAKMSRLDVAPTEEKVLGNSESRVNVNENDVVWKSDVKSEVKESTSDCSDFSSDPCVSSAAKSEQQREVEEVQTEESLQSEEVSSKPSEGPIHSAEDIRVRDEEANLLSEFADKCSKEMAMKDVFNDSPPESAENSPSAPDEATSPSQEEQTSTKSEQEANMEVEAYMRGRLETNHCSDSHSGCDFSTASSDSAGSSSSSVRGFDTDLPSLNSARKKKFEDDSSQLPPRKKRREKLLDESLDRNLTSKSNYLNDSDPDVSLSKLNRSSTHMSSSSPAKSVHCHPSASSHRQQHHFHRPSKYNFIDLEEGKYLEGEDRIAFLTNKIQDLRSAYMELKAEVASIDRRRRRHRVKEKEMAHLSGIGSSSSTLTPT